MGTIQTFNQTDRERQRFVDAGVETFIVRFASRDHEWQLDASTREIFPSFRQIDGRRIIIDL